ncbi:MAG: terminase small subunit [Pseudomonas sp.]
MRKERFRYPAGEPTGKKRLFCSYYVADKNLNGSAAAIKAGYAEKSAAQTAYKFLLDPECKAYIARLMEERCERVKVDADYVLRRLTEIDQLDVLDILTNDGDLKPLRDWPKEWRQSISGVDISSIISGDVETILKKIKFPDKLRNLELLGKHVDVGAFREQIVVDDASSLAEKLAEARARAARGRQ